MKILAIVALIALAIQYALALLHAIADPNKTPVLEWGVGMKKSKNGEDISIGKKIVTAEMREMTDIEKRRQFMWFALSSIPAILFLLIFLIKEIL
jgi:hypothetical protein